MKLNFFLFGILVLLTQCKSNSNSQEIIEADLAFSALSEAKGLNHAFIAFAHDSAVLLKPNYFPIIGKSNIEKLYSQPTHGMKLTWKPLKANIAKSGELGYSYGTYTFVFNQNVSKGTYVTIWEKTKQGWKYVLDSGNDGLEYNINNE